MRVAAKGSVLDVAAERRVDAKPTTSVPAAVRQYVIGPTTQQSRNGSVCLDGRFERSASDERIIENETVPASLTVRWTSVSVPWRGLKAMRHGVWQMGAGVSLRCIGENV